MRYAYVKRASGCLAPDRTLLWAAPMSDGLAEVVAGKPRLPR